VELQACNYEPYEGREHEAGGRPANCHAYRLQASDKPVFERDLMRMGLREVDRWLSAIFEANDLRALMAVLLMRCTRLKSLNMASELLLTVASDSDTWLPSMLDHCLSAPVSSDRGLSRFDRLTSVVITAPTNDTGRRLPRDVIKWFFRIPSLVTLDIACCPDLSIGIHEDVRPEIMAGCVAMDYLVVLRLPLAAAFPRTLKALFQLTPKLKTLMYDILMPAGLFPNEGLVDALAMIPETTEELTIRVHMYVREAFDLPNIFRAVYGGGIGSLQRLRNLNSLTIPLSLVFGHDPQGEVIPQLADVLPRSLESLYLVGDLTNFNGTTMNPHAIEAILCSLLTGEESFDQAWNHMCSRGECGPDCRPLWECRAAPRCESDLPRLKRITVIENDTDAAYDGGEGIVIDRDQCEALEKMLSDQGLELVHSVVYDYKDIPFDDYL